jgi:hypothetical protein
MSKSLSSVSEVIQALGGTKAVAQLFDLREAAVGNWRIANAMPPHTFTKIQAELIRRGTSADINLWKFNRKKSERRLEPIV